MKQMMKNLVLFLAVIILAVPAGAAEKNMVYSSPYNITTLDPSASYSTESQYMSNIYETLLKVNPPGARSYSAMSWPPGLRPLMTGWNTPLT